MLCQTRREYADVAWSSSIPAEQRKIFGTPAKTRVQKHYIYGCFGDLWAWVSDRREGHCRRFAEGFANSERTNNLLPPTRLESHARNLRNASNYSQLRIRTSRFQKSPIPYLINLLNQQTDIDSLSSFIFLLYHVSLNNNYAILLSYYTYLYLLILIQ